MTRLLRSLEDAAAGATSPTGGTGATLAPMPTRKQRRRRDKTFRHEYDTVLIDEDGNETPLAELRTHDEPKKSKPAPQKGRPKGGRGAPREVPPPSWERAFRKGGMWGVVMLVVSVLFLFRTAPIALRVGWGVLYAIAFVPLTYYVDRTAYRAYIRRSNAPPRPAKDKKQPKQK